MKLKSAQKSKLSDFANMLAVAWFTAGVISPLFLQITDVNKTVKTGIASLTITLLFVYWSITLVRKVKL
ncbi:hypothetical protein A3I57_00570 [Candidatus Beckwithbacteria bacterium RIFCSPLOWO2_02_FULL_47_23]|uniref:Uncharacterized protein n=2 Tax=Candidatus Beckwithiibacteriota TaxID=1752726 RepID=A0A1F5DTL4_9BACT|nr:MAG: hypothetical protein A3E73_02360 [Candidatus Beckwithbacteria bacterium RIFCSPHIGHO2_12_FULL_47_17]OGD58404.1 MAG: hypothetical protein A3I57_00570 [Candidatus Beckwithbacteria bacterium RIFCSPLOWO2_02_FULL_47_23]